MPQNLDWSILFRAPYGGQIADAVLLTVEMSLVAWICAFLCGLAIAVLGHSRNLAGNLLAGVYMEVFRNIPLLVQLFFAYYVLPLLLPMHLRRELFHLGWEVGSAVLTLTLYTGAKVAAHLEAGFNTAGAALERAALSTGLTWWQAQRRVVVPLVLRAVAPSLTSEFVTVFKSSSLAMTVGVVETSFVAQAVGQQTFHWVEAITASTLIYLACACSVTLLMGAIERATRVPGMVRRGDAA